MSKADFWIEKISLIIITIFFGILDVALFYILYICTNDLIVALMTTFFSDSCINTLRDNRINRLEKELKNVK